MSSWEGKTAQRVEHAASEQDCSCDFGSYLHPEQSVIDPVHVSNRSPSSFRGFPHHAQEALRGDGSTNLKPFRLDKGNLWVNIAHEWTAGDRDLFLEREAVKINPVAIQLCRSGECMCGTQQSKQEFVEAAALYPEWGSQMKALDEAARKLHGWGWGEPMPLPVDPDQLNLFEGFQPMCGGCNRRAEQAA